MSETTEITIGLSPCPNDTFIFHALLEGTVRVDCAEPVAVRGHFADVERLNGAAIAGTLPVTKVSLGVMPDILTRYAILASGAALGWGVGPLVVARDEGFDPASARIAIPGRHTTANLLLNLTGRFQGPRTELLFSDIMPAVARGDADLGVIIHEGRFTYGEHGLRKVLDLGQWWEDHYSLPLPLGCIVARRDLPLQVAQTMEKSIEASLAYAREHPEVSRQFIADHAQELDGEVIQAHIDTFVTDYSLDLGAGGRKAIMVLLQAATNQKLAEKDIFLN